MTETTNTPNSKKQTSPAPQDAPDHLRISEQQRIAENKAWLTPPIERIDVGPPSVDASGTPIEHGGPKGPEPTRYGDWEKKGICVDF